MMFRARVSALQLFALLGIAGCMNDATIPVPPATVVVATLTITPAAPPSLALGRTLILQAVAQDSLGATVAMAPLDWVSSDSSIVAVQSPPRYSRQVAASARAVGTATITARSGLKTATVTIAVHAPGPTVTLMGPGTVALGKTADLVVILRDSEDVQLVTPALTFDSSDSTIASVSNAGVVIARAQGTVSVSATSNGVTGSKAITVTPADHAFLWTEASGMKDLGVLPGFVSSRAFAVSAGYGHVAGTAWTVAESLSHAFVRRAGTDVPLDLAGLTRTGQSEAFGVNSDCQIVGDATTADGLKHAVLWDSFGVIQDLGTLPGGMESAALAINDAGQVVGWSRSGADTLPFIWTEAGGMRAIIGPMIGGVAFAINQAGVVTGAADGRPFLWSAATLFSRLPLIPGELGGWALAINSAGEIVGASVSCNGGVSSIYDDCSEYVDHAVLWVGSNAAIDLRAVPGSVGVIERAAGISNSHEIVGTSFDHHAIRWSAAKGLRDLGVLPNRGQSAASAISDGGIVVGWSGNP